MKQYSQNCYRSENGKVKAKEYLEKDIVTKIFQKKKKTEKGGMEEINTKYIQIG